MRFNLLTTRAGSLEVGLGVPADLGLSARAAFDVVRERTEPRRELGPVDGGRVLLRLEQLSRLECAHITLRRFGEVEHHDVRMQLGGDVALDRARAVMLEPSGHPPACGLGRSIPTEPGLYVAFE